MKWVLKKRLVIFCCAVVIAAGILAIRKLTPKELDHQPSFSQSSTIIPPGHVNLDFGIDIIGSSKEQLYLEIAYVNKATKILLFECRDAGILGFASDDFGSEERVGYCNDYAHTVALVDSVVVVSGDRFFHGNQELFRYELPVEASSSSQINLAEYCFDQSTDVIKDNFTVPLLHRETEQNSGLVEYNSSKNLLDLSLELNFRSDSGTSLTAWRFKKTQDDILCNYERLGEFHSASSWKYLQLQSVPDGGIESGTEIGVISGDLLLSEDQVMWFSEVE